MTPDTALIEEAAARLCAIQVSLLVPTRDIVGCDGDSYELTLGSQFSKVTLCWWEEPPAEWSEAGAVTWSLLEHLERHYVASEGGRRSSFLDMRGSVMKQSVMEN